MKMGKHVTPAIEQQVIEMYHKGFTYSQIIKALDIGSGTITRIFKKHQVKLIRAREAIEMYMQGVPMKTIASTLEVNENTVLRIVKRNGHSLNRGHGVTRKHAIVREDFFEEITTEEQAYFLGWMISDGSVKSSLEGIEITVSPKDDYILKVFCDSLGTQKPLERVIGTGYSKGQEYSRLAVFSKQLVNSLIKLGVVPSKSSKTIYPNIKEDSAIQSALIRGLFDGDGCISINKKGQGRTFYLVGTYPLLFGVSLALSKYCGVNLKEPIGLTHDYIHSLTYYSRTNLAAIHQFLYGNATPELLLQRKFIKFNQVINSYAR
jgi:transposase-like protein